MRKRIVFILISYFFISMSSIFAEQEKEEINIDEISGQNNQSLIPAVAPEVILDEILAEGSLGYQPVPISMPESESQIELQPQPAPRLLSEDDKAEKKKKIKEAYEKRTAIDAKIQNAKWKNGELDSYEQLVGLELKVLQEHNKALRDQVDKLHSELAEAYHVLGNMYTEQKFYGKAITAFERSIECGSRNPLNYYHLGLIYEFFHGDTTKSLTYLAEYLKTDPPYEIRKKVQKLVEILTKSEKQE